MPLTPIQITLIAAGSLLGVVGCWLLLFRRKARREAEQLRIAGENPGPSPVPVLTEPTRVSIALGALILGYHLIAWAFPPNVLAVQLTRQWWWVWCLAAAGVIVASLLMDRVDRRPPSDPPSDPGS